MESEVAVEIFARSVEARNLIKHMSEIGTAKLILQLAIAWHTGPFIYILKEECKSHVTRMMETGLRSIVKNYEGIT